MAYSRKPNRVPKHYDGTATTGKQLKDLLPDLLEKVSAVYKDRPDLILMAWPSIIGEKFAPMTRAVSFENCVLTVLVKNATLHSLLAQHEKVRLLKNLRDRFPQVAIRNIVFRIG